MERPAALALGLLLAGCRLLIEEPPIDRSDARFAACGGVGNDVVAAFPMRAADYKVHFPKMGISPELDVDEPAFAVVLAEGAQGPVTVGLGEADVDHSGHFVCVYVGSPPTGIPTWYANVDIEGMNP